MIKYGRQNKNLYITGCKDRIEETKIENKYKIFEIKNTGNKIEKC